MRLQVLHQAGNRLDHFDSYKLLLRAVDDPGQAVVRFIASMLIATSASIPMMANFSYSPGG